MDFEFVFTIDISTNFIKVNMEDVCIENHIGVGYAHVSNYCSMHWETSRICTSGIISVYRESY